MSVTTSATPYIGDMDMSKITFGPCETKDGKTKVEVYRDASSTARGNRINKMALCRDAVNPMTTRFPIDTPREDAPNPYRRGLGITVSDPETLRALHALDDAIVKAAITNSKEWFKGKMFTEEQVRARYKPIVGPLRDGDESEGVKVKVKCPGCDYPTTLHHRDRDGRHYKNGGRVEHLTWGAMVVPIVSASYGLWFMGGGTQFGLSFQAESMIVIPGNTDDNTLDEFATSAPLIMADKKDTEVDNKVQQRLDEEVTRTELMGDEDGAM